MLHRIRVVLSLLCISMALAWASGDEEKLFMRRLNPIIPEIEGKGGITSAGVEGYPSLIGNPAAFAAENRSITVLSANPWLYMRADRLAAALSAAADNESDELSPETAKPLMEQAGDGGIGFGASAGIGYAGRGLGLGILGIADVYLLNRTPAQVEGSVAKMPSGYAAGAIEIIAGFSVPFDIGPVRLSVGGNIRPQVLIYSPVDAASAAGLLSVVQAGATLSPENMFGPLLATDAYYGWAFSVDAGILMEVGPVSVGVAMRDIADTRVFAEEGPFHSHLESLAAFEMPETESSTVDEHIVIPMDLSTGIAYRPDMGKAAKFFQPRLYLEFGDIIHIIREKRSFLHMVHVGAEATLFRFLVLRGGYSQGYFNGGFGFVFPGFTLEAAYTTMERGYGVLDTPNRCISVEAAVRF